MAGHFEAVNESHEEVSLFVQGWLDYLNISYTDQSFLRHPRHPIH